MLEKHRNLLIKNRVELVDNINLDERFWSLLIAKGILTADQRDQMKLNNTRVEQVARLLDFISRRDEDAFDIFCRGLHSTNQGYIVTRYLSDMSVNTAMDQTPPQAAASGPRYDIGEPPGRLLCINNIIFNRVHGAPNFILSTREGAELDSHKIKTTFDELGFKENKFCNNLSSQDMKTTISDFVRDEATGRASSVVFVISSHGKERGVYGSDYQLLPEKDIIEAFDSTLPCLKNKPKLLLFQACRNQRNVQADSAIDLPDAPDSHVVETDEAKAPRHHKREDMVIARATVEGEFAMRNTREGSWFITAIHDVFRRESMAHHVLDLLTMVNDEVKNKLNPDDQSCIQLSDLYSTLSKSWFLVPSGN